MCDRIGIARSEGGRIGDEWNVGCGARRGEVDAESYYYPEAYTVFTYFTSPVTGVRRTMRPLEIRGMR